MKTPKNILPAPQAIVLHTLLYAYVKNTHSIGHGCTAKLHRELTSKRSLEEVLKKAQRHGDDPLSHDAVNSFLLKGRAPTVVKARVYEDFLILKGYLTEGFIDKFSPDIYPDTKEIDFSTDKNKDEPDLSDYEGSYFYESSADRETIASFIVISPSGDSRYKRIYIKDNIYLRETNEMGFEYQKRINSGKADKSREYYGLVINYMKSLILISSDLRSNVFNDNIEGNITKENSGLIIVYDKDNISRIISKISMPFSQVNFHNLTKREINNIVKESSRYISNYNFKRRYIALVIDDTTDRERNRTIIKDIDKNFLLAAEEANPIDMIKFLMNGADINVQDPETGWTALHFTARKANAFCVSLFVDNEGLADEIKTIFKEAESEGIGSYEDIDLKIRACKKTIDPLILSHDHRFASEMSDYPIDPFEAAANPYYVHQRIMSKAIWYEEQEALIDRGLDQFLKYSSMEKRLHQLGIKNEGHKPTPSV